MDLTKTKLIDGTYEEFVLVSNDKLDLNYSDFELHVKSSYPCKIIILQPTDLPF